MPLVYLGSSALGTLIWEAANLCEPLFIPVQPTTVSEYPLPPIFQGLLFQPMCFTAGRGTEEHSLTDTLIHQTAVY